MTPIAFLDTETDGLRRGRRIWEIAIIRRDAGRRDVTHLMVSDVNLANADPFALKIGRFYDRHPIYNSDLLNQETSWQAASEATAARQIERATRGATVVGAVPNFDTEALIAMFRRHGLIPAWHYHLVDVENLAVGWLRGQVKALGVQSLTAADGTEIPVREALTPPWSSDDLSRWCGVPAAHPDERHTALGDALWVERWYDTLMG